MSDVKHTPTPWYVIAYSGAEGTDFTVYAGSVDTYAFSVAAVRGLLRGEGEANAAFIVRACNSHDALVAALKTSRAEFTTLKARLPEPYRSNSEKCCALIDAALKAAKGEA